MNKVTRRGVYLDLALSPYEYETPYGDRFKFSSQTKLRIYERDVKSELIRIEKALDRLDLPSRLPPEITTLIYRTAYQSFYHKIER